MKTILIISLAFFLSGMTGSSIYDFKIQKLDSEEVIDLASFKGKKILIVNVASKCGFTSQYEDLQSLYEKYQDKLVVIGFPCNQFLGQEPGTESLIKEFCSSNYGVTFPMTTKIDVKGSNQHPIYRWLTKKDMNGIDDYKVGWNFNKFLIDEEGNLIGYYPSNVEPFDQQIIAHLK